ncbi:ThiF family adenylyltransferase [Pseudokineococcus sp. 1T1Z-3]|uniref:ThiF family adenylyltransferase n=1 Tax=Pseudokineococcus sp. 1T1Z-3 TaxID=3132745 RepID=UPI0030A10417
MTTYPVPPLVQPGPPLPGDRSRRYARQAVLPELGDLGQRRLAAARVLVVGAGGLGSPVLLYLAAAGVGTLGVVDDDVVDRSNLQRQVIHREDGVGRAKTESAAEALGRLDSGVEVVQHRERLTADNALRLVGGYDLVVDASDGTPTRYLVDDACGLAGVPYVWGSVLGFAGQVGTGWVGDGPCYRDLFPVPPTDAPTCAEVGVLGAVCASVGAVMATEALKLLVGVGEPLVGRVLVLDALAASWRTLRVGRDPRRTPPQDLSAHAAHQPPEVEHVDAAGLRALVEGGARVLDVREPDEHATGVVPGSVLLPLGEVLAGERPQVPDGAPLVVVCAAGGRSAQAAAALTAAGVPDVVDLRGGLARWDGPLVSP